MMIHGEALLVHYLLTTHSLQTHYEDILWKNHLHQYPLQTDYQLMTTTTNHYQERLPRKTTRKDYQERLPRKGYQEKATKKRLPRKGYQRKITKERPITNNKSSLPVISLTPKPPPEALTPSPPNTWPWGSPLSREKLQIVPRTDCQ